MIQVKDIRRSFPRIEKGRTRRFNGGYLYECMLIVSKSRYSLAEDLNKQLDDLSRNLSLMIDEVNKLSTGPASVASGDGTDDPTNQLSAILGAHLRALSSIDGNAEKLDERISELEGRMGQEKGRYGIARR
jgi:nuclear pore complex protein Nup62